MKKNIRKEMTQEIIKEDWIFEDSYYIRLFACGSGSGYDFLHAGRHYSCPTRPVAIPSSSSVMRIMAIFLRHLLSGKGSCLSAGALGDDMDDTRPSQLYILSSTGTMLVARVVIRDAVLPVPTDEFFTVEETFKSFVAWLRHLVGDVSDLPQIGQEGSPTPKKTHLSEDEPLGALDELAKIISDAPMNLHWDSTTFGREAQIPLYLHQQDVRELALGREEINITLIQLWMMYMFDVSKKKGFSDVCGFIDPSMTHERNKFDDIQTYITTCFGMGKEIYFFPYIHGSLATHMMLSGRSTATAKKLAWVALKRFNMIAPIPEKSLQLMRKALAKYVI
ncbi:hypothetical protein LR48_Vigan04g147000 [Vigna angularis]|uniref:Uncharacterized protein n=1 Tax=Phaseolus angularis TaxID=3914 RepID=A0A0L9UFC4_PHAAN|nr:hypothetical protein LR48_Vigan04g147000 [Vigna angularis]